MTQSFERMRSFVNLKYYLKCDLIQAVFNCLTSYMCDNIEF